MDRDSPRTNFSLGVLKEVSFYVYLENTQGVSAKLKKNLFYS